MEKWWTHFFQMGISLSWLKDPVSSAYLYWDRRNYQTIYREPKPVQEKRLTRRKINPLPKDISYNEEDDDKIGPAQPDAQHIDLENESAN